MNYFTGNVEEVLVEDETNLFQIRFSIPGILENLSVLPKAYPRFRQTKQVTVGDTILIFQPSDKVTEFFYEPVTRDSFVGIQNLTNKIDITEDGVMDIVVGGDGVGPNEEELTDVEGNVNLTVGKEGSAKGSLTLILANKGLLSITTEDGTFDFEAKSIAYTTSEEISLEAGGGKLVITDGEINITGATIISENCDIEGDCNVTGACDITGDCTVGGKCTVTLAGIKDGFCALPACALTGAVHVQNSAG